MKRDELNNLHINNSDGHLGVDESPLGNLEEVKNVPEVKKSEDEVFKASEENKFSEEEKQSFDQPQKSEDSGSSSSSSSAGATSAGATVGAVGGVVGVIAVSAALVIGVVKLPTIPAVDVRLIAASGSSLAFSLKTNIEDHSNMYIVLKGADYEMSTSFQEYVKFNDLKQNEVYTLSVYQEETSRYSSNYYTNTKEDINNINITVTSYIDDKLYFYFEDSISGEKLYTVTVKNKTGSVIYTDETSSPKEYEIDNFKEDVAIFVAVNGTISAGIQVFKPIYDYENINWVWGKYGETVTAIIPSMNETDDYYVRDIRNFEIKREDATCTEDGYVVRQAAFIGPDKNRYESQKEFVLPSNGHDFSDVTYTWSNNYQSCKAEATCPVCDTKIEESVVVTSDDIVTDTNISFTKYTASFENEHFGIKNHYENLVYGAYPQSLVSDTSVTSELDQEYGTPLSQSDKWTNYNYYAAGNIASYMSYVDVDDDNDGAFDYRGVFYSDYRPINTVDALGNSSYQYDNGYLNNKVYWFKYEPISWEVLTQDDGKLFIASKIILDSQSYYHENNEQSFSHNGGNGYANNYELSDMRKWLNEEFYNAAFASDRDIVIDTTEVDNSLASTLDSANDYISNNTSDKVFLLSRYEANEYLSNSALSIIGSDYAKSQGLYVALENNKGFWGLRTPYPNQSSQVRYITNNGNASYDMVSKTSLGIRPACWINIE